MAINVQSVAAGDDLWIAHVVKNGRPGVGDMVCIPESSHDRVPYVVAAGIGGHDARKTLFTRDGDGTQRLVSLAGEIQGTAQSLMDAFIGESRNGRNIGLLNQLWQRLYDKPLPKGLITKVDCRLQKEKKRL